MKRLICILLFVLALPSALRAQVLEDITVKEILPTVNGAAQTDFAADAVLTNTMFFGLEYQGIGLEMDIQSGKATGWLYRYYSESLDSSVFFVGVKVPIVGAQTVKLPLDTITQYFPVTIGTTALNEPWADSDAALQGAKDGGADTFIQSHPETRVAIAFTINNPVQNRYIPQGKYWVFRFQADTDTMTCMVDAPTGLPFRCIAGNSPTILTNPPSTARVGVAYVYNVNAFGNPLPRYRLNTAPAGMTIDDMSGRISWTPAPGSEGQHDVEVEAYNNSGSDTQTFTVTVSAAATEPRITSSPVTEVIAGQQYMYRLTATGSPPPTYTLEEHPTGMLIDGGRGSVLWAPTRAQSGEHAVRIRATNAAGSDEQSYTLDVITVPVIAEIPDQRIAPEKEFSYQPATDAYPDPAYTLNSGPDGLTIDPSSGLIQWTPTTQQTGKHVVLFEASNRAGKGQRSFDIEVDATVSAGGFRDVPAAFRIASAWPQPAGSAVTLSLEHAGTAKVLHVRVYDALGRPRLTRTLQHAGAARTLVSLPVHTLESGMYNIVVGNGSAVTGTRVIVRR